MLLEAYTGMPYGERGYVFKTHLDTVHKTEELVPTFNIAGDITLKMEEDLWNIPTGTNLPL
jgi:hypothetical protein